MLKDMHPDLVQLSDRFNRHHHFVDYSPFKKNKLIKTKDNEIVIRKRGKKMLDYIARSLVECF